MSDPTFYDEQTRKFDNLSTKGDIEAKEVYKAYRMLDKHSYPLKSEELAYMEGFNAALMVIGGSITQVIDAGLSTNGSDFAAWFERNSEHYNVYLMATDGLELLGNMLSMIRAYLMGLRGENEHK